LPPALGFVKPFLKKADEMHEHDPVVAYFCKFYAVDLAWKRYGTMEQDAKDYVANLIVSLEQEKTALKDHDALSDDSVSRAYVEEFALNIFKRADDEDRAGRASIKTANAFLASSVFLEVTRYFGEPGEDITAKIKYAKWKAVEIAKAIKAGKMPTPGPHNTAEAADDALSDGFEASTGAASVASPSDQQARSIPPSAPVVPVAPPAPFASPAPPALSMPFASPAPSAPVASVTSSNQVAVDRVIASAEKHVRFARSALQYEDIRTAVNNLQQAL
ncbi:Vta1 like-domain-containing protein, partial [Thamnocephalis sphaerospora]